jgi:hypothetical protein
MGIMAILSPTKVRKPTEKHEISIMEAHLDRKLDTTHGVCIGVTKTTYTSIENK